MVNMKTTPGDSCQMFGWFYSISFVLVFGLAFLKQYRLSRIYGGTFSVVVITNNRILQQLLGMMIICLLLTAVGLELNPLVYGPVHSSPGLSPRHLSLQCIPTGAGSIVGSYGLFLLFYFIIFIGCLYYSAKFYNIKVVINGMLWPSLCGLLLFILVIFLCYFYIVDYPSLSSFIILVWIYLPGIFLKLKCFITFNHLCILSKMLKGLLLNLNQGRRLFAWIKYSHANKIRGVQVGSVENPASSTGSKVASMTNNDMMVEDEMVEGQIGSDAVAKMMIMNILMLRKGEKLENHEELELLWFKEFYS